MSAHRDRSEVIGANQNDAFDPSTSEDDLGVHTGLRTSEDDYDGSDAFACR